MIELKRSDRQYVDIEKFRDYEYTECIVFEMATRASKALLLEMFALIMKARKPWEPYSVKDMNRYEQLKEKLLKKYWVIDTYYFSKNSLGIYEGNGKYKNMSDFDFYINSSSFFYHCSSQFALYYTFLKEELVSDEVRRPNPIIENDKWNRTYWGRGTVYGSGDANTYEVKSIKRTSSLYDKENSTREITKYMVRPKLIIPKEYDGGIDIKINPYLPTSENIIFLEKALADIKKGRKARSTYELIQGQPWREEDFELEPLYIKNDDFKSKKVVADMFYTYDYITQRQKELEESNNRYKEECVEEIEQIKADDFYTSKEKQENIKEAKRRLDENLFSTVYTTISKEDNICRELEQNYKTIQRYFSKIKPFIEDMKYQELLTGLQL